MSDLRSIKTIYINQESFARGNLSSGTWSVANPLVLYRGTQVIFRVYILLADGVTAFAPPAGATWLAGIDNEFGTHPDLVLSQNDQFNIAGDWDSIAPINGQISFRMDLTTNEIKDELGTDQSANMWLDIWMTPIAGKPVLIAQFPVTVYNIAVDPTTAVPVEGLTFVTSDAMIAAINNITSPTGGLYRLRNGAWQLKNQTTGKFRTIFLTGDGGTTDTITYGPEED